MEKQVKEMEKILDLMNSIDLDLNDDERIVNAWIDTKCMLKAIIKEFKS